MPPGISKYIDARVSITAILGGCIFLITVGIGIAKYETKDDHGKDMDKLDSKYVRTDVRTERDANTQRQLDEIRDLLRQIQNRLELK